MLVTGIREFQLVIMNTEMPSQSYINIYLNSSRIISLRKAYID